MRNLSNGAAVVVVALLVVTAIVVTAIVVWSEAIREPHLAALAPTPPPPTGVEGVEAVRAVDVVERPAEERRPRGLGDVQETLAPSATDHARPAERFGARGRDEASLMTLLHQLGETDPALSLRLAREGNDRFAGSQAASERGWIVVKSLVNMERFEEAQAEAVSMVDKYRGTSWAADVERHLLVNPLLPVDP